MCDPIYNPLLGPCNVCDPCAPPCPVQTWRLPPRTSGDRELFAPSCEPQEGRLNAVTLARDRLVDLEQNIERRYLKPPLGTSKGADLSLSNLGTEENNTIPRPLLVWRDALPRTTTAAQVSMCLYALEMSVAWDKSIMKAVSPLRAERSVSRRTARARLALTLC